MQRPASTIRLTGVALFLLFTFQLLAAASLTPDQLLNLKSAGNAVISPDGRYAAYVLRAPRTATDEPGSAWTELHVYDSKSKTSRPFITGKTHVWSVQWRPDGSGLSFTARRGEGAKTQVWFIPLAGGESRPLTAAPNGVSAYAWHPNGKQLLFTATDGPTAREKALRKKGYGFIYFEENLKHRNLYRCDVLPDKANDQIEQLTRDRTVWNFKLAPNGKSVAFRSSEKNLVDYSYMFSEIYQMDLATKNIRQLTHFMPRKIGNYAFSPDGKYLAVGAPLDSSDNAVSQAYVIHLSDLSMQNVTPVNFAGHINWVDWKDKNYLIYRAAEGTVTNLYQVRPDGSKRKKLLSSESNGGVVFRAVNATKNFKNAVFTGSTPTDPSQVYWWRPGKKPQAITALNPDLKNTDLGKQVVYSYQADDGQTIEGLLIYPVGYQKGKKYPLVVLVHGGPESNHSNGWLSRYSTPGQVLAGKGYAVVYLNYRSSTGYGVEFARTGLGDAAGREFDDIRDAIKALIKDGIADADRVGLGGGSYGGYAAAWFATYYTQYVKAACMFVGISDLISKRGTTDIAWEELYVHSGKRLEEMWKQSLERSPIYYAHQSKTATLIFGGAADPRVHPSQSMELYRRMKMNNHPAVRLVQYPGEGHGNRRQPGQIDVLYRILDWYDWYVKDGKPLDGSMPPLDISAKYGLDLPEE